MILLDTCTMLWLVAAPGKLSRAATAAIKRGTGGLYVASISAFELSLKQAKGRLELPMTADDWYAEALSRLGLKEIAVDGRIAALSGRLPFHHADPCDRIIIATAAVHGLVIATPDTAIARYTEVSTIW